MPRTMLQSVNEYMRGLCVGGDLDAPFPAGSCGQAVDWKQTAYKSMELNK